MPCARKAAWVNGAPVAVAARAAEPEPLVAAMLVAAAAAEVVAVEAFAVGIKDESDGGQQELLAS